ncbi:MAG: hypothetical protein HC786_08185 [Richelia sp. CSU_2_1]|nr:hypothetical protein [Microcoleus sp. SU_5_3]NJR22134.1 hypothetical protein [Richelia sp. CSU_2_1]
MGCGCDSLLDDSSLLDRAQPTYKISPKKPVLNRQDTCSPKIMPDACKLRHVKVNDRVRSILSASHLLDICDQITDREAMNSNV